MKKVLQIFISTVLLIIAFLYFVLPILFVESYYPFYPHIDTKFAKGFSIENFEKVTVWITKIEVESILGKPLYFSQKRISSLQPKNAYISVYASDGKSNWSDNAWESFDVYFDSRSIVSGKSRKWWTN